MADVPIAGAHSNVRLPACPCLVLGFAAKPSHACGAVNRLWQKVAITPGLGVDELRFGISMDALRAGLGEVQAVRENHDGEVELLTGGAIFRCLANRFVECTFPDTDAHRVRAYINGVPVLSVHAWLGGQPDVVDRAFFRISLAQGIAYDRRGDTHASYTVFEPGHWDSLFAD